MADGGRASARRARERARLTKGQQLKEKSAAAAATHADAEAKRQRDALCADTEIACSTSWAARPASRTKTARCVASMENWEVEHDMNVAVKIPPKRSNVSGAARRCVCRCVSEWRVNRGMQRDGDDVPAATTDGSHGAAAAGG
jgi:hypothetical protein